MPPCFSGIIIPSRPCSPAFSHTSLLTWPAFSHLEQVERDGSETEKDWKRRLINELLLSLIHFVSLCGGFTSLWSRLIDFAIRNAAQGPPWHLGTLGLCPLGPFSTLPPTPCDAESLPLDRSAGHFPWRGRGPRWRSGGSRCPSGSWRWRSLDGSRGQAARAAGPDCAAVWEELHKFNQSYASIRQIWQPFTNKFTLVKQQGIMGSVILILRSYHWHMIVLLIIFLSNSLFCIFT